VQKLNSDPAVRSRISLEQMLSWPRASLGAAGRLTQWTPPCYFGYSLLKITTGGATFHITFMLRLILISHSGRVIERFGDANRFEFMVRNGEQNFAEIIIPIKKSFLQIFGSYERIRCKCVLFREYRSLALNGLLAGNLDAIWRSQMH
jgi:hypothetical protein